MVTCTIGSIFILKILKLKMFPFTYLDWNKYFWGAVPLAVLFCTNIVLGNISLRWVPVSFMQTVKSSVPFFAVVLERNFFWDGSEIDRRIDLSLVPIVGGVAMATYGEVNFNWIGFLTALIASVITALIAILSFKLLKTKLDAVNLLYYMAPLSMAMLLPFSLATEYSSIRADWATNASDHSWLLFILVISGLGAFFLNISTFLLINNTSALTYTVSGNVKIVINIVLSVIIFQNEVSWINGLGCFLTIVGAIWYSSLRHEINEKQKMKKLQQEQQKRQQEVGNSAPNAVGPSNV
jgi:solute carrier family 35 protein E3